MKLHEIIADASVPPEFLKWFEAHRDPIANQHPVFTYVGGVINVEGNIFLQDVASMPFKFGTVVGEFHIYQPQVKDLTNAPDVVKGNCVITRGNLESLAGGPTRVEGRFDVDGNELKNLDHFPAFVGRDIDLDRNNITSLQGVHKKIKQMNGRIFLGSQIRSHLLGAILVEGCQSLWHLENKSLIAAVDIINKHIGKGKAGVLAAQQELLDAGMDDYAQL